MRSQCIAVNHELTGKLRNNGRNGFIQNPGLYIIDQATNIVKGIVQGSVYFIKEKASSIDEQVFNGFGKVLDTVVNQVSQAFFQFAGFHF